MANKIEPGAETQEITDTDLAGDVAAKKIKKLMHEQYRPHRAPPGWESLGRDGTILGQFRTTQSPGSDGREKDW